MSALTPTSCGLLPGNSVVSAARHFVLAFRIDLIEIRRFQGECLKGSFAKCFGISDDNCPPVILERLRDDLGGGSACVRSQHDKRSIPCFAIFDIS